eukprot:4990066-Amphidinium_carterae.2
MLRSLQRIENHVSTCTTARLQTFRQVWDREVAFMSGHVNDGQEEGDHQNIPHVRYGCLPPRINSTKPIPFDLLARSCEHRILMAQHPRSSQYNKCLPPVVAACQESPQTLLKL